MTLSIVLGVVLLAIAPSAMADAGERRIKAKTAKAMDDYDMMEFEAARVLLQEAIAIGEKSNSKDGALAQAYLSLGIVYYSGLDDRESALESFENAVRVDSSVEIGVAYRTPEISQLLTTVRGSSDSGDCSLQGIAHVLVDEAPKGRAAEIRARLGANVHANKVTIFYRSEGQLSFSKATMKKQGDCEYVGNIPGTAFKGDFVHYYVAAVDQKGKELERKGSSGSPNIIEVASASGGSVRHDDDNPLNSRSDSLLADDGTGFFLSMAVGSGAGYVNGPTEKTQSRLGADHFAAAYLHILPEIGYFLTEQLAVSAAFRMGFPLGANVEGHATFAPAGLLKARYMLSKGGEGFQVSGAIGGGIIRNIVPIDGAPSDMNTDTTAMGPLLLGAGVGYSKSLGGPMRLVAELGALGALTAGFDELGPCPGDGCVRPKNGVQLDANLALLFAF